jgi:hypothetical protein
MSLFKNQNNDFEKKLRDQLDETEFKPSDSLWSRIDQEVNRPEFEKRVEGKIGNYQLKPYKETWEQIEAQLPPEPNGKNRRKYLWIPLTALLFVSGLGIGFWLNKMENNSDILVINGNEQQVPSSFEVKPDVETEITSPNQIKRQNETLDKKAINVRENSKPKQNDIKFDDNNQTPTLISQTKKITLKQIATTTSTQTTNNSKQTTANSNDVISNLPKNNVADNQSLNKKQIAPPQILNKQEGLTQKEQTAHKQSASHQNQTQTNEQLATEKSTLVEQPTDTTKLVKNVLPPMSDSALAANKPLPNQTDEERPSKLSLSIIIGAHYSQMHLYTNKPQLAKHVALRNQIESAEIEWSGAFLLNYEWKKFLISSGIQFTNFSMGMTYGTTPAAQQPKPEPNSQVVTNDSVTTDGINNTRIRYSWNEIPLLITYRFTPHKRLGIEAKVGVSYAFISTVDAALVGQNNVGVIAVKNKESFPFVKNSLFGQVYLGLAYQVNSSITLTAMPYLRYSLNSMIDGNYAVKQHPYMLGMSVGLRKHF